MRSELRRRPFFVGTRFFFIMVGVYAFLTAVVDVFLGDGTLRAVRDLTVPALATSLIMTWLLWRGSKDAAPPSSAA
jgi:hypothetical protein